MAIMFYNILTDDEYNEDNYVAINKIRFYMY